MKSKNNDNLALFKQALNEGVINNFDAAASSCADDVKLNADSVNYLVLKLKKLVDDATILYLSDEEIPADLADALGDVWEKCRDYIEMYENYSRI